MKNIQKSRELNAKQISLKISELIHKKRVENIKSFCSLLNSLPLASQVYLQKILAKLLDLHGNPFISVNFVTFMVKKKKIHESTREHYEITGIHLGPCTRASLFFRQNL